MIGARILKIYFEITEIIEVKVGNHMGGAAYLYLISILIWPHFDT